MFKIIKELSLAYLQDLFSIRSMRLSYYKRALGYSGVLLWNSLPVNLRKPDSPGYVKGELDKFYSHYQSGSHTAIL